MLVILLTTGARISFRSLDKVRPARGIPAVIYGAGRAGEFAIREMLGNPELALKPIGFIDDDPSKRGRLIQGYPVVGGVDMIPDLVRRRGVQTVVVGSRRIDPAALERLRESCERMRLDLLQLQFEFQNVTPVASLPAITRNPSSQSIQ
jgi:FlaA1/EpsC-like NDP-sugar epimerase